MANENNINGNDVQNGDNSSSDEKLNLIKRNLQVIHLSDYCRPFHFNLYQNIKKLF